MPCKSDYLEPDEREYESARVMEFLREVHNQPFNHKHPHSLYGNVAKLDRDTDVLCHWCQHNDVTQMSLELQLWYREHREADEQRKIEAEERALTAALRRSALLKLTPAEIAALGLDK